MTILFPFVCSHDGVCLICRRDRNPSCSRIYLGASVFQLKSLPCRTSLDRGPAATLIEDGAADLVLVATPDVCLLGRCVADVQCNAMQ